MLVRPVNGIALLALPFLADTWPRFRVAMIHSLEHPLALGSGAVACALIVGSQLLLYHQGTGHWWIDSYAGEGFNWGEPHILDILFSYRKGLFLYTPMFLLALAGLYAMHRQHSFSAWAWLGFFGVLTYVLSSWWSWWYGGSFSSRPYVEYLPLFAIPLGLFLHQAKGALRSTYLTACLLALVLCQVQTYQARYYRIHYADMDKDRYWAEFLRLDKLP
jgi:ABC-type branched-subunit amino acid transport system permease subunit